jgi:hypothetical protein
MHGTKSLEDRYSELDENVESIVDDCIKYESVGKFLLCPLEDIVEIENEHSVNEIELHVDTPFDEDPI